jgi:hypothetical protein
MWCHDNFISRNRHEDRLQERRNLPFSEALNVLNSGATSIASLGALEVKKSGEFRELLGDIGSFPFLKDPPAPLFFPTSRYFVYRNAGTGWHYHPTDESLMCQIVGSKRIGLLEDDQRHFPIVSKTFMNEQYYESECSFNEPECRDLKWFSAELREGDALYIPASWWHGVVPTSNSFGITATICWRSPISMIGNVARPTTRLMWSILIRKIRNLNIDRQCLRIMFFLVASLPTQVIKAVVSKATVKEAFTL